MDIEITKEIFEAVGPKLKAFGLNDERIRWSSTSLDLTRLSNNKVKELRDLLAPHNGKIKGVRGALRDLGVWIEAASKGANQTKCKNCKHFAALAFEYIQKIPHHWLYVRDDDREVWVAWYVSDIEYHEKVVSRDGVRPAYARLTLCSIELGATNVNRLDFHDDDCRGRTAPEILRAKGWIEETAELAENYRRDVDRYVAEHDKIGKQFLATGVGTTNLDGNGDSGRHYWWHTSTLRMERLGEPSRVVIDVRFEGDQEKTKEHYINWGYWRQKSYITAKDDEDADEVGPEDQDSEEEIKNSTVKYDDLPLFPVVPVFCLRRHMRLRVHIANLTPYAYDKSLGDKLVLPDDERGLVSMLVAHEGGFKDIIGGKGGGAIVLCCGIPGTGKTLTSEVYAEVMGRALYSVQCSQLGTDEQELEKQLLKVFARAQRWGAILLLDEADVYVAARGSDLKQNAIVGVFLRVLEYYQGVLFMTTNRADLVDDAIGSRCLARVEYTTPTIENQKRIWKILADAMGVKISPRVVEAFAKSHSKLTGRDVKNLLKLAMLVSKSKNEEITVETLTFVSRFKPTV